MQQTAIRNVRIISGLRRAVADKELSLQFQPIFTADSTLDGAEALLRWHHPEWGAIPPATFIPLAEGSGLIAEIGRWVIEEAVDTYREIRARGGRTNISVNLSTKQLLHPSFIEEVLDLFADNDVEPSAFCLEITENSLFEDTTTAITRLRDAGQQGLTFAIDDFGKGFSALAYLKELPVHLVKIDKSFVQGLPENPRDAAVVDGVLSIARGMGFDVVAEGIETDAQRGYLAARGCRFFQGFGLARPMSRADFVAEASKGEAPDAHTPGSGVDAPGSGLDAPNSQN
jgi:EAL domain-containing protein (putative c-di-GMP-specific phosphodiesterase class I)